MNKYINLGVLSVAASIILAGCGGSSSTPTTADSSTNTGYFVDAAVFGADYNTSSGLEGSTDKFGRFQFKEGDEVEFRIGKVLLGRAKPKIEDDGAGLITPEELAEGNETVKTLILQLLQALDANGNPEDGITIPPELKKDLEELNSTIDIHHVEEEDLVAVEPLKNHIDKDHDGVIDVEEDDAIAHFENSKEKWKSGYRPDKENNETKGKSQEEHGQKGKGNSQENEEKNCTHDENATEEFNLDNFPKSENLTQDNKNDIAFMGNEERLAFDVYSTLYAYHAANGNEIKQLTNIATKSETKHISIVRELVNRYEIKPEDVTNLDAQDAPVASATTAQDALPTGKYDITHIQELYDFLEEKGKKSVQDALEVGCMVEVTDINDLNPKIENAIASGAEDLKAAFEFLRDGSYNHYWAFDKGLKNLGVENGCCSLGEDWCHSEYPQNEKGNEGENNETEHGQGQGKGKRGEG